MNGRSWWLVLALLALGCDRAAPPPPAPSAPPSATAPTSATAPPEDASPSSSPPATVDAGAVDASTAAPSENGPSTSAIELVRRWNAGSPEREVDLPALHRQGTREYPIGKLWCSLVLTIDAGEIRAFVLRHEAKAQGKWSCTFAEKLLLRGLLGDTDGDAAFRALELRGDGTRAASIGGWSLARSSDNDNGKITGTRKKP